VIEIVAHFGVIRLQPDCFLKLADRLVNPAFHAERGAEVIVGIGIIGFQA